jgi:hypothetical protein
MAPMVARIVQYQLSEADVARINLHRGRCTVHANRSYVGDILPLLILRVCPDGSVNGQVFLDGDDTLWVTSVREGDTRGTWASPARV